MCQKKGLLAVFVCMNSYARVYPTQSYRNMPNVDACTAQTNANLSNGTKK